MKSTSNDPLSLVRRSREEISRRAGHDPAKVIATLRRDQKKYATQIRRYTTSPATVDEEPTSYPAPASTTNRPTTNEPAHPIRVHPGNPWKKRGKRIFHHG